MFIYFYDKFKNTLFQQEFLLLSLPTYTNRQDKSKKR